MFNAAINGGDLLPGDRVPTQRTLADWLGIDVTTVTRAYNELKELGLLHAVTGSGSFVSYKPETLAHVDLSMNTPPGLNRIVSMIAASVRNLQHSSDIHGLMAYHVGAGSLSERLGAVKWLEPLLGDFSSDRVVVCPGAQTAISILLMRLASAGDTIVTDELTYPGLIAAAKQQSLKIAVVESDSEGIIPEKLREVCILNKAKLIYLNPTIQNPTAISLSNERRKLIADFIISEKINLIEDDPYGLLPEERYSPIATLAPENTYYISTLSKCLSPGLRVAWIIIPESESNDEIVNALRSTILVTNPLMLSVVTDWINSGTALVLLEELRRENAIRQQLATSIFCEGVQHNPYGLHLWVKGLSIANVPQLMQSAATAGLGIAPSYVFSPYGKPASGLRISLGAARDNIQLGNALNRLHRILKINAENKNVKSTNNIV